MTHIIRPKHMLDIVNCLFTRMDIFHYQTVIFFLSHELDTTSFVRTKTRHWTVPYLSVNLMWLLISHYNTDKDSSLLEYDNTLLVIYKSLRESCSLHDQSVKPSRDCEDGDSTPNTVLHPKRYKCSSTPLQQPYIGTTRQVKDEQSN